MCFAGDHILNMRARAEKFNELHPIESHLTEITETKEEQQTVGAVLSHLNLLDDENLVRVVRESARTIHAY